MMTAAPNDVAALMMTALPNDARLRRIAETLFNRQARNARPYIFAARLVL